eukprot:364241-Chlamydomonas_euryale.AAC.6
MDLDLLLAVGVPAMQQALSLAAGGRLCTVAGQLWKEDGRVCLVLLVLRLRAPLLICRLLQQRHSRSIPAGSHANTCNGAEKNSVEGKGHTLLLLQLMQAGSTHAPF